MNEYPLLVDFNDSRILVFMRTDSEGNERLYWPNGSPLLLSNFVKFAFMHPVKCMKLLSALRKI